MRILYLIHGIADETRAAFVARVLKYAREILAPLSETCTVAVTESAPPRFSVIPFRRDLVALISLGGAAVGHSCPRPPAGFAGAYEADTAWPVVHERSWPLGVPSPGVGLLTLFRKRRNLPEEEFLRRWFGGHTPLTLRVHPNAGYVRDRVVAPWETEGIVHPGFRLGWDGIVEEQYDPPSDLLNPARFFGGSVRKMLPTMLEVYRDVRGFIDYNSIRTWLTVEYRLKERSNGPETNRSVREADADLAAVQ